MLLRLYLGLRVLRDSTSLKLEPLTPSPNPNPNPNPNQEAALSSQFAAADTDADGTLSYREFVDFAGAALPPPPSARPHAHLPYRRAAPPITPWRSPPAAPRPPGPPRRSRSPEHVPSQSQPIEIEMEIERERAGAGAAGEP